MQNVADGERHGRTGTARGQEPVTGRDAAVQTIKKVNTLSSDDTYMEVLSGETHHAAHSGAKSETPRPTASSSSCPTQTARSPK